MWLKVSKSQFDFIASTLRNYGKGYEWHTGDYTSIKVKEEDLKKFLPQFLEVPIESESLKKIIVNVNGMQLDGLLLREQPRIALCQDRVVLLDINNNFIAHRDLLSMFTTTELTNAKYSFVPKQMPDSITMAMSEQYNRLYPVIGEE